MKKILENNFYRRGITVIEMLLVISILGILVLITVPRFSDIRGNQVLKNAVEDVTSVIHNAKNQSLASLNSSEYGVYFQADKIITFKGKIYSPEAVDNKTTDIISPATISNVTLAGVSSNVGELYFERLSGIPSKTGTITISTPSTSKIITISATGAISIN